MTGPGQPPLDTLAGTAELAISLLDGGDALSGLRLLRGLVAAGGAEPGLRINLAIAEQKAGDAAAARGVLEALADDFPHWDEPQLRLASYWRAQGETTLAVAAYRRVLTRAPDRPEALLSLGVLLLQQGDVAEAVPVLQQCCAVQPDSWQAWDALSAALLAAADHAAAYAASLRANTLAPFDLGVAWRLTEAARAAGCGEDALAALRAASAAHPLNAAPLAAIAVILADEDRLAEAAEALEAAAALAPDDVMLAEMHADMLMRGQQYREAVPVLQRAIALDPAKTGLRNTYAAALARSFRYVEAQAELQALLQEHGESAPVLCNLVGVESCLGEQEQAVVHARRAAELLPDSVFMHKSLANAQCYADGASGEAVLATLRRASQAATRGRLPPWPGASAAHPGQRLRLGLLSADLRSHPVGFLTLAGLENLSPETFELVAVSQPVGADPMQRRFHSICAEWHVIGADPAAQVRALELDMLIDLGGYGDRGLMHHCAERLAPVQIKWVGMQNHSSGMAEMDWFVTDRWETPPGQEHLYSERLLVMPDGYVCYSPPPDAPGVAPLPALRNGRITFGCFNNYAKVTPRVIATWCAVLHAVPDARLVLKSLQLNHADTVAAAAARFAVHGIDPARIDIRGGSGHRALLAQYADVDLVLDPFPYSGGLTTCEALWMGVPAITMPGTTFASRHSTSHLCNVGLDDWVVADLDGYCAQAVRRAADLPALADLRATLRPRMKASPLCDGPRFGRNLGAALRHVWHDWCARAGAEPGARVRSAA